MLAAATGSYNLSLFMFVNPLSKSLPLLLHNIPLSPYPVLLQNQTERHTVLGVSVFGWNPGTVSSLCPAPVATLRSNCEFSSGNMEETDAPHCKFKIILGSSSVARRKILAEMGYEFTVMSADIDEKAIRKEKPEELVMTLAEAKADAILSKLQKTDNQGKDAQPTTILIAADTVVVYEGKVREKPSSKEEAREFIKGYSGGQAATVSSILVTNLKTGVRKGEWDKVQIDFHEIPDKVIDDLIEEGHVLNVAGGLIIEHPLILPYVKQVVGATDSVMGLPKDVCQMLINETLGF